MLLLLTELHLLWQGRLRLLAPLQVLLGFLDLREDVD
jgi:hypothetical protein